MLGNVCLVENEAYLLELYRYFPQIVELDINPLIVGQVGSDPVVADARMTFAPNEDE